MTRAEYVEAVGRALAHLRGDIYQPTSRQQIPSLPARAGAEQSSAPRREHPASFAAFLRGGPSAADASRKFLRVSCGGGGPSRKVRGWPKRDEGARATPAEKRRLRAECSRGKGRAENI